MSAPVLEARELCVRFGTHTVLRNISFELQAGETVGLVGESGSGKSTLARALLRLVKAQSGSIDWRGEDLLSCTPTALRRLRRNLQIVFQDPLASLNPRMSVGESVAEPLKIFEPSWDAPVRKAQVESMLDRVGLEPGMSGRYPHELSGGQCQRVGIARAMVLNPALLICDEPVSSLDVSVQGQIVNLLLDLQRHQGMAMLFISHNLAVVRHVSHRILVMYAGALVETAQRDALFAAPIHPYTRALLASVPRPPGASPQPPALIAPAASDTQSGAGCAFRSRCAFAIKICAEVVPLPQEAAPGHFSACHRSREFVA